MKRIKKMAAFALAAIMALSSFTACANKESSSDSGSGSAEEEGGTVTVKVIDSNLFSFAQKKGLLDQYFEGLDVDIQITEMKSVPVANEAFAAGEADFCIMGNMPGITGAANDYGIKIIGVSLTSEYAGTIVVPADSEVQSVEDLKGKKVGTFIGGGWHYITAVYLENVGLSLDDIELLNTAAETATGIRAGELDAGVVAPETAQALVDDGSGRILAEKCGEPMLYTISASEEFITAHPDITKAYLRAVKGINEYINTHKDEYFEYFEERTGADPESTKKAWDLSDRTARSFTDSDIKSEEKLVEWMKAHGFISEDFTLSDYIDDSLVKEIEAEGA